MDKKTFKEKVQKQLWFLNKNEKEQLNKKLSQIDSEDIVDFNKPIQFSNRYLKNHIYERKSATSGKTFILLFSIVVTYALLLGLFLTGLITSLTSVHYFINPKVELSSLLVIIILIAAICIMILSLYLIKIITALFTKKLLELKFNKR
ncbi:hypothetical protein [Staphylococcus capitis]|uniref:hypothetical protein n=1 Tax=Staphylococcus capitis TaxID=29388 RepID=UPI000D19E8BA|nr:hypothetical protein [Staphylococcus capitis]PTG26539.1 hypothetical protein BU628_04175 [Staphylococcus capitis]